MARVPPLGPFGGSLVLVGAALVRSAVPDPRPPVPRWELPGPVRPVIAATVVQLTDGTGDADLRDLAEEVGRGGAHGLWTEVVPARRGEVSFSLDDDREWRMTVLRHDDDGARVRMRFERRGVRKVDVTVRIGVDRPFVLAAAGRDRLLRVSYQPEEVQR